MKEKCYVITVINEERWIECQKIAFSEKEAKCLYNEMKKKYIDGQNVQFYFHIQSMEFDNTSNEGIPFRAWMK